MYKLIRRGILLFLLSLLVLSPCSAADYLASLRESVSSIELGAYDRAARQLQNAFSANSADPLGHTALGVIYLHTGRYKDAEKELRVALNSESDSWRLYYALGMVVLAQGRTAEAKKHFDSARELSGNGDEMQAFDQYMEYLTKPSEPPLGNQSSDLPVEKETYGVWAFHAGRVSEATAAFNDVLHTPAPLGFEEFRAPLVTFDPRHPIRMPKAKLTWKPPVVANAPVLSDTVILKADTRKTTNVAIVTFTVDGDLIGMTNCVPFKFEWNTTNHSNGAHDVKIEARDAAGGTVSAKKIKVVLSNTTPKRVVPLDGPEVQELQDRLWNCVKLTESRKLAHYYLGKILLKNGDRASALAQLQYAVAYDPNLLDARHLMSEARGSRFGYTEVWKGKIGYKRVALTFDDGPNEGTRETLQVLKRFDVPATFFVVGFRAESAPETINAILSAGHEIENHTYTHPRLPSLRSLDQEEKELAKGAAVVLATTGKPSLYFRPPGGRSAATTRQAAARLGLTGIFWTLNTNPYEGARYQGLAEYVIKNATDGAIILMHNGETADTAALQKIIPALKSKGYTFVTVSDLMRSPLNTGRMDTAKSKSPS